ncbi:metalloregulator ArsR/SmtB family transcription factor [Agromyces sp. LHK192]|uniref:metalloregulator ArsR/SmtB family transcription factor n=1 Tax=Agromyces sp. LHK192 TaxID=2498704 RepID=UPI00196AC1A2|nr:metalloregulator ArsR/SmtB family transcription factor [Agromyces sp. LHK192]
MTSMMFAALGDENRWRMLQALAERPRSVGVLAELTGLRQPQTTKHLQTLARAGLVVVHPAANRRYYGLREEPLRELAAALSELADRVAEHRDRGESFEQMAAAIETERLAADRPNWADDRRYAFTRSIDAPLRDVWRRITEAELLAAWWSPRDLRLSELEFTPAVGGRVVFEYVDADDPDGAGGVVGRAEGRVDAVDPDRRIAFHTTPLLPDGSAAFTAHLDLALSGVDGAVTLEVDYRITDSVIESADFVAGIRTGMEESLDALVRVAEAEAGSTSTPTTEIQED